MNAEPTRTWEAKVYQHPRQLLGVKLSPCGTYALAGDFDGAIQRWNLASDQKTALLHHETWVQALAFHPDRRRMFSTDYWGGIACWSYADEAPRPLWSVTNGHPSWIRSAVATPDGRFLVTAGNDLVLKVWDCENGRPVRTLTGHASHVYCLAVHPDGATLVSGDQQGVIKQWDLASGRHVRDLDASPLWHSADATMSLTGIGGVRSMAFSRDGAELVCGGMTEPTSAGFATGKPTAIVFDWRQGRQTRTLRFPEPGDGFVTSLLWHPDGFLVGSGGGQGGSLWFWRSGQNETFHAVRSLRHIRELALHADGLRLVAATFEARGSGGNGRGRTAQAEYVDNVGTVRIYSMTQRPAAAPRR